MQKIINIVRMSLLGVLALTSIPLIIHHFTTFEREHDFMLNLHVIIGILFLVSAGLSLFLKKKQTGLNKSK
jgi:hypothetical protein